MTSQKEHFDYIFLGTGAGAKFLAWTLSGTQPSKKIAAIEERWIGGACTNIACLPSKNFVNSANVAHLTREAQKYGLSAFITDAHATAKVDMAPVQALKAAMVKEDVNWHISQYDHPNCELISGRGVFRGPKTVEVNGRLLEGEVVVIGTGSKAFVDDAIPGLTAAKPMTHVELLDITILPSHLIILGGGYVGVEFAQAFRRFGSEVTVIERNAQVLNNEDQEVSSALVEIIQREGVKFHTSTTVKSVSGISGQEVEVTISNGAETTTIRGSDILVATGRVPNTTGIGLAEAGIKVTDRGHVAVDEQLRTSVPGVFAVGDCAGSPYFTHMGVDDFRIVYANLVGHPRPGGKNNRQVPSTLFTSPELAHVGLREKEAQARGIRYRLTKLPMAGFLRTHTNGQTDGFAKALLEVDGDRILGFTALGHGAGELLPVVQLAMKLGAPYTEIADMIMSHPIMNEGLMSLFMQVPPRE